MKKLILIPVIFAGLVVAADEPPATAPSVNPAPPKPSQFGLQGTFAAMGFMAAPTPTAGYEGRVVPANESPSLTENRLNVSIPVYKSSIDSASADSISVMASGGQLHFSRQIVLDNTGTLVPANFYRDEIGGIYFRRLENDRAWGFRGSVGSASDKPFEANRDITFSTSANYSFPASSEKARWVVLVFFSNNSPLGDYVPFPGFIYVYKTDKLFGMFGIPLAAVQWMPIDPWSFSLSIFGPIISMEAAYVQPHTFQTFVGLSWNRQMYLPSNRQNDDDRLTLEEKKAMIGFRTPLFWNITSEFQLGESFERSIYIGEKTFDKSGGAATLDSGPYVSWNFKATL